MEGNQSQQTNIQTQIKCSAFMFKVARLVVNVLSKSNMPRQCEVNVYWCCDSGGQGARGGGDEAKKRTEKTRKKLKREEEEKRKRFPPYMYKKILHLLKSPLPHIHPHHYSNGPSLEMAEVGYCLIIFIFRYI